MPAAEPPVSVDWLKPKSWALSDDPNVLIGQYANLKRQVPLLYLLLIIIALSGIFLMIHAAPLTLLVVSVVSAVFVAVCAIRMVWWLWFLPSPDEIGVDEARALLRRTTLAVIPICLSYLGYAFLIDHLSDPSSLALVAICLVMTALCCIFCLTYLPQAALLVNLVTMVPYALYQVAMGNETFLLVAIIAGVVATLMVRVSLNVHEGFVELVTSRAELGLQRGEAERLASENASLAMTDVLTGMPNRRLFLSCLDEWVQRSAQSNQCFVVGILDLDRFKPVNDIYGHATGDQLLLEVGGRLQSIANDKMVVGRLGGDEFGLLLDDDLAAAEAIGERIIGLLGKPFLLDGHSISLGCSIGFAAFPDAGSTASSLFDRADYALYDVKTGRHSSYAFFTPDLETRLRAETELEAALLSADLAAELQVELQPIICLGTAQATGVEALARWNSPAIGKIQPTRFIEAAERLNLMGSITTTLFQKSLTSLAALPGPLYLSFNLSTRDIVTSDTIDMLIAAITRNGIAPNRVTFEITETALMQDFQTAIAHIERLRRMGASIALDDFGTGFSSLSYLSRLPVDTIKIDRSFVCKLGEPGVRKIVSAILGMCDTLEVECIAEGVETVEECLALRTLGCDIAQGHLFAPSMKADELALWLVQEPRPLGDAASQAGLLSHPAFVELHKRYAKPSRFG